MAGRVQRTCDECGSSVGFVRSDNGFFYCGNCYKQADDIFDTGVDDEQLFNHYSASCNRARPAIHAEPMSQVKLNASQYLDHPDILVDDMEDFEGDGLGPTEPSDFGSCQKIFTYEEYYSEIRSRYLMGLQIMIQLQCQALVEKFNVNPLIVGLVGPLWLRFLTSSRIMDGEWADKAVHDSETQTQGEVEEFQPSAKYRDEPVNIHGKRVVSIWLESLRSTIPISSSWAISFLACHVAREAILPSDILKWAIEGELPFFAASDEIEKQLGPRSEACPISIKRMLRPVQAISSQKLESVAANIAQRIGLELPPVNFYAIATRYCSQLSLPTSDILPMACRVCEWSTPSELYLSANEFRIPTRAYVMSILIVTIRIRFDINGYGVWESSFSDQDAVSWVNKNKVTKCQTNFGTTANADEDSKSTLSVVQLLQTLDANYNELDDEYAYSRDLPTYLRYCKDVVFAGLGPSYEDLEEEKLIEELWDFYQKNKDVATLRKQEPGFSGSNGLNDKVSRNVSESRQEGLKKPQGEGSTCSTSPRHDQDSENGNRASDEFAKDIAIRRLKMDMEENKFCYIPPRVKVKNRDYLHYARKRKDVYIYAVHADYYVLLRSCAKVAQVETRIMHIAVLCFERRLQWLEKRIDFSLNLELSINDVCDFCKDDPMDLNS